MDRKFIICVVLANLAQSSFAAPQSSNVGNTTAPPGPQPDCSSVRVRLTDYGLSPKQAAALQQIIDEQKSAIVRAFDSLNPVCDFLDEALHKKVYNRTAAYRMADETYSKMKSSVDHMVSAISLTVGKACHIPDKVRATTYEAVENVWVSDKRALEIVGKTTKPHSAKRTEIEALATAARGSIKKFTSTISDTLRRCVNTKNSHTLAAIDNVTKNSTKYLISTNEAFYGLLAEFGTKTHSSNPIDYRTRALNGKRDSVESIFALLRAIFLSNYLNLGEIVSTLYTNQYLEILTISGYNSGTAIIFATIVDYLQRIYLGRPDAYDINSPALNASQNALAARFQVGSTGFTRSILNIASTAKSAPVATPEFVRDYSESEAGDYYTSIKLALDQRLSYAEARQRMNPIEAGLYDGYTTIIENLFDVIRACQSQKRNIASGITTLQRTVTTLALCYIDQVFAAINILNEAAHGIRVLSDDDFVTVENLHRRADFVVIQMARAISVGQVRVIRVQRAD